MFQLLHFKYTCWFEVTLRRWSPRAVTYEYILRSRYSSLRSMVVDDAAGAGQGRLSGEVYVDSSRCLTPFGDCPHDQGLPATTVCQKSTFSILCPFFSLQRYDFEMTYTYWYVHIYTPQAYLKKYNIIFIENHVLLLVCYYP